MEALSLLFLIFIFALIIWHLQKPKQANNVIPFRNYHRIEWLKKRRAAKAAKLREKK